LYLIIEFAEKGEIYKLIEKQGKLKEKTAKKYIYQAV